MDRLRSVLIRWLSRAAVWLARKQAGAELNAQAAAARSLTNEERLRRVRAQDASWDARMARAASDERWRESRARHVPKGFN